MRHPVLASIGALAITIGFVSVGSLSVAGQAQPPTTKGQTTAPKPTPAPKKTWTPSRTAWGHPDLEGIWDFQSVTPLERPGEFAGKEVVEDEEAPQLTRQALERSSADRRDGGAGADLARAYNEFWYNRKPVQNKRTSLVVDPADGRVPPLTPAGLRQAALPRRSSFGPGPWNGPEDLDTYARCISRVMPRLPQGYNSGTQIIQTPDSVVFRYEQLDRRIVPLDGSPHINKKIRQWNGDSRGHWEGNTLVVDTTNFTDKQDFRGIPQGNLHLIERYTRVDAKTINYVATLDDPTMWTRPWTFLLPWQKEDGYQIFEYACHEGNYAMEDILSGSRVQEQATEGAARTPSK